MKKIKFLTIGLLMSIGINAQVSMDNLLSEMKYYHVSEEKFGKYVEANHMFDGQSFTTWKSENKILYYKELWYQSKSFYVKKNHLSEGITLDESIIDISRFESYKGILCEDGVYVYRIIAIDNINLKHEKTGHVTLLK